MEIYIFRSSFFISYYEGGRSILLYLCVIKIKMMKKHIPNLITSMNVISGTFAIFVAMYGYLELAAVLIILAMVFDFFDGFAARLLHVKSEMGKELDSLADGVSFGVAPAILAHFLILRTLPGNDISYFTEWTLWEKILVFSPVVIPAFSAYRLAKFNLDIRQTVSFIGMPTPANALFWISLVLGAKYTPGIYNEMFANIWVLGLSAVILSILLISELPMFSLKISGFSWKENKIRYSYFICLILGFCIFGKGVIVFIIPLYILFAILDALKNITTSNR